MVHQSGVKWWAGLVANGASVWWQMMGKYGGPVLWQMVGRSSGKWCISLVINGEQVWCTSLVANGASVWWQMVGKYGGILRASLVANGEPVWWQMVRKSGGICKHTYLRTYSYRRPSRRPHSICWKSDFEAFNLLQGVSPIWNLWHNNRNLIWPRFQDWNVFSFIFLKTLWVSWGLYMRWSHIVLLKERG